jgi:hypothetical protein
VVSSLRENRAFAESKNLWREELFTKSKKRNSRRREKLSVNKFFAESQEKTLGKEFFAESKPAGSR